MLRVEGTLVHRHGLVEGAVVIDTRTGLIEHVGPCEGRSDLDARGCLIFPGFGDIHIHAREDVSGTERHKEDFTTAAAAAAHGGVVQVADMPNNPSAPIDDVSYNAKLALAQPDGRRAAVQITLYAGIGPGTRPLRRHVPYKAFMGPSVGDLFFESKDQLREAIARYRGCNVSFHCEDPQILEQHRGAATHEARRPAAAETDATAFALELIETCDLTGKLCHYSTRGGLPQIAAARSRGVRVTCEVTPHHLYFDDSMLNDGNRLLLQMNPPLRSPADRLALIEALRDGTIDYLATDHAPHTLEEKAVGVSGVPHLDTYGAFTTWLMAEHGFTPQQIGRVCAENPGRFTREFLAADCGKGFGRLEPGYMGSLTLIDPAAPYTVRRDDIRSKVGWSPFEGITFPGRVRATVLRGSVAYADRKDGSR